MASRISFKQMQEDITDYIGGQVFLKSDKVTDYEVSINVSTSDVKEHNGNILPKLQKENVKLIQIIDNDNILVGIAFVKSYNNVTDEYEVIAVEYGKGNFAIYKSKIDLDLVVDNEVTLTLTDLDITGITMKDLAVNQIVYDKNKTVGFISSIDLTNSNFKVKTMTTDTISTSVKTYKSNKDIDTVVDNTTILDITDLDGTVAISDIELEQLVYDENATVAKITNIDTTNNQITVKTITRDTIATGVKIYKYKNVLDNTIDNQVTINFSDLDIGTTPITDLQEEQLVYDKEGTVSKIVSIDTTANTLDIKAITTDTKAIQDRIEVDELNKTIKGTTTVPYADIITTITDVSELVVNQLVYDKDGTVAKITSIDTTNNEIETVTITTAGGGSVSTDRIKTSSFLSVNVGSTSQIPVSTLSETDITKLKENQIVFDSNGAVGYISSIDTTNSQVGVTTMTVVDGSQLTRLLSNEELNKTILGNTTLEYTDLVTSLTVNELVENLLVYDADGTVAKIDSISTNTTTGITTIVTTTLTTSADDSFDMKYYRYNNALDKTVDTTHNILFSDLTTTATTTINDLQIEQIIFDGDGTVSKIENIDTVNGEVTVRIISSGITNTPIKEYKTTETLSQVIDSQQVINVPAGLNVNDIEVDQLVYDQEGTVARIVGIDTTANTLTVQIMTGLGMPVAPDHKKPTIKNGGSGYAVNDIIETTTPNVFVKVTAVDTNGIITDVLYDNTATSASPTSGTKAIIDYDQVIYGGYGKNWYELQGASVLVAQTVAEGFTYIQGYEYSIDNAGTGYVIDDIIATNVTNQYVRVTDVDTSGEILSVEFTRETTVNTSGSGATITATSSTNVFIIPDDRWNTGTALFTITNDDGASVQFLRTDPITTKYNAGASGKIYKFVYNPINGTIIQSFAQMSGGSATEVPGVTFEENHSYKEGDLIVRNNKMYVCNGDYTSTNDFDTDLANGSWRLYEIMEIGGEIV